MAIRMNLTEKPKPGRSFKRVMKKVENSIAEVNRDAGTKLNMLTN